MWLRALYVEVLLAVTGRKGERARRSPWEEGGREMETRRVGPMAVAIEEIDSRVRRLGNPRSRSVQVQLGRISSFLWAAVIFYIYSGPFMTKNSKYLLLLRQCREIPASREISRPPKTRVRIRCHRCDGSAVSLGL